MALSSPGIGSGLDVKSIVQSLMSVEQQPLLKLGTREVELKAQLSAYGSLKGAVSTFRDAIEKLADIDKFKVFSAKSSDDDVLTATASSSAATGGYNLQVQRIAENHRMASTATFADTGSTLIGVDGDSMTIAVGADSFVVAVGGKTLGAIRDAINDATDNTGMTASIIKDDAGSRLVLSANETGGTHALAVTYSGTDPFALTTLNADRDSSGGFTNADLNASVTLEGQFTITSSTNSLTEAIQGVSVQLNKAGSATLQVARDTGAVEKSVQSFVKAYSDLITTMNKMRGQTLKSDSVSLLSIESQLRAVLNENVAVEGQFENAFALGISTEKNGTLAVDASALDAALKTDFAGVANLFADPDDGLAVRLQALADSLLEAGGPLDGRTQGLDNQIREAAARKAQLEERLKIVESRYTSEFNALDGLVSQLQSTSNLLTQQLAMLSGNKSGS